MTKTDLPDGCIVRRFSAGPLSGRDRLHGIDSLVAQRSRAREGAILLFTEAYDPIVPANIFLKSHCHQYRSLKTQHAYADDLAVFWSWMGGHGLSWKEVDLDDLQEYSAGLSGHLLPRTGRKPSAATVIRRVATVELFYRWAYARGLLASDVFGDNPDAAHADLPRTASVDRASRRPGAIDRPKRNKGRDRIRPLSESALKKVMNRLGASPFVPRPRGGPTIRNRLMAEVAYATGMRVDEICALTVDKIDSLRRQMSPETPTKLVALTLTVTKGGGERDVFFHYRLWKAVWDYVKGERSEAMNARLALDRKAGSPGRETTAVFVNGPSANERDVGRQVRPQTVSAAFTRAVLAEGLTYSVTACRMDDATGGPVFDGKGRPVEHTVKLPNHTFHDLRHTFAVRFYRFHVDKGRAPPWKTLQAILGHALMSTTTDVYLRHCDAHEGKLSDDFCAYVLGHVDAPA